MDSLIIRERAAEANTMLRAPAIRAFVTRSLSRPVRDDENFFESGLVTSIFGMQLITFLESTFKIEILDEDLDLSNFNSISNIQQFVARKVDPV